MTIQILPRPSILTSLVVAGSVATGLLAGAAAAALLLTATALRRG